MARHTLALVALALVGGFFGGRYSVRPDPGAVVSADSLDVAADSLDATVDTLMADTAHRVPLPRFARHDSAAERLRDSLTVQQATTDATLAAAALADTVRLALEAALTAERAMVERRDAQQDSALAAATEALALSLSRITKLEDALVGMQGQRDEARRQLRAALSRPRGHGWRTDAVILGAGALLAVLATGGTR